MRSKIVFLILLFILTISNSILAQGERIYWEVQSNGGNTGITQSSTNYAVAGTFSQTTTHYGISTNYFVNNGYWQVFDTAAVTCDCFPGDADNSTAINILDIVYLIDYKQKGGPAPVPYNICSGDVNCDCTVDILDIIYLIDYKQKSGPPPCNCTDWADSCGIPILK